ncbi:transcriptional regulator, LysR family [Ruegeria halocynthiae]|uniref:Transcriptional regulator, LysR family n=1 Tax=Ruegeria halocynthiae TaxID=985054 RepID=A0A1H3F5P8_9RHOB|nr:LysR family transcriptional regulator [Ruegeria halocynthiae]SDX86332.1 transcriptional regulator, LysR family [Ruegeria halocynthiae]
MKFGLRHIRYFIAVAEELHFRRAAERLGVAQPALSRAIQYLERELEVTLFVRSKREVQITRAGETFLKSCRGVVNSIGHAVETTRMVHSGEMGSLRIGYTDMAIAGQLPTLLKEFQEQRPNIVLRPHHDVTVTQLKKLDEGELDIGFVTGPISRTGYEQCPIQSENFVCIVYESHPLAGRNSIRLEELAHEDFVHGSSKDWEQFYSYLFPLCRRSGFVPNIVQEAFNSAGILGLVACGMGVTILTDSVSNSISSGLVAIPIEDVTEQLQTVAFWKVGAEDGAMDLFVEFLQQHDVHRFPADTPKTY